MIPIEEKAPKPVKDKPLHGLVKYPFAKMEVGNSFIVPKGKNKIVIDCARHYVKKYGLNKEFSIEICEDKKTRCFRIK